MGYSKMRISDVTSGIHVIAVIDNQKVSGVVNRVEGSTIVIDTPEQTVSVNTSELNLKWFVQYDLSYPKVGHIQKGSRIRLGRPMGKSFIPGETTLFADGFKEVEGETLVIGRNLNLFIYKELRMKDFKKKWILEKTK